MQELVWLLINNCDMEAAAKTPLLVRSPFLGYFIKIILLPKWCITIKIALLIWLASRFTYLMPVDAPAEIRKEVPTLGMIAGMPSPVVIKSHLPFYLLNSKLLDASKKIKKLERNQIYL